jgi:ABC-2 type transport system ATP-binding protein
MAVWLEHVYKRFDEVIGVEDLSFGVPQGAIVGVIGPSGAGKTTSIRLMTGALKPDSGLVRVLGEDPRHFHRRTRERIGYMPQLFVLYPDLTARENVDFMAALFGMPSWRRRKRVDEVLELVDLEEARNRRASALSGGMQRRLELACALVHQPSLLILDEPTAGIDPLLRTRVWQELDRLRKSGATLIVTTQYVTESEYCDSVALISEGNLVANAAPEDLRRQALGGDVIEVGTTTPFDVRALPPIEGVVSVRQTGPAELSVVVEDAGVATPRVNDAIEAAGGTVDYSREFRPTFDEIFATLVTNHGEQKRAAEAIVSDRVAGAEQAASQQTAPPVASAQAGEQATGPIAGPAVLRTGPEPPAPEQAATQAGPDPVPDPPSTEVPR